MSEKEKYDGMRLAIRLQKPLAEGETKAETIGEFSMFGRDVAKGLRSADPQTFTVTDNEGNEKKVSKLVAFVNDGDITVYQTNEFAKSKGLDKGERVGVLFAREYEKDGVKRIMLTGYFDNNGIKKDSKLSETPYRAASSLFGPGAEQILTKLLETGKARMEKRATAKAAVAQSAAETPAEPEPAAVKGPSLDF